MALGRKAPTSYVSDSSRYLGVFVSREDHQSDPQGHTMLRIKCSIAKTTQSARRKKKLPR